MSGKHSPTWKGGKHYLKSGYVRVHVAPCLYKFEHVVVMEQHLGRHLVYGETVHHINGVKNDNRLLNLELWCKPQPSGIRASDALAWAREIVARYENTTIDSLESVGVEPTS